MDHRLLLLPATLFVLAAIGAEWWITHRQGRRRSVAVMLGNGWMALFEQAAGLLLYTGLVGVYAALHTYAPVSLPEGHWATWVAAFLGVDLAFYAYHRFCHGTALGWSMHAVHHQSPQLDFTAALRNSPFGGALQFLFHVPLALLGVPPGPWVVAKVVNPLWQLVLHTEAVGRIPLVEGWLNTPSAHRVHHGTDAAYRDRNFGGMLVIWDRWFGTYTPEAHPTAYGTTPPLGSLDPLVAQWEPVRAAFGAPSTGPQVAPPETGLWTAGFVFLGGVATLLATVAGLVPAWLGIPGLLVGGSLSARVLR